MKNERVTVVGFVEPKVITKCLEKIGKKVDLPGGKNHYISNEGIDSLPFNNGFNFGKGGNKNKNGLNGKMLLADGDGEVDPATSDTYTHIFSDENANSCSLM
ncbi:hypothetical protein KP509_37G066200 [Ceratopteris richardii]|nr:hypothetical protein KP509_37G066200 [Ceratopteris richardii]